MKDGSYTPPPSGFNPNPKTYEGQWIYYVYDDAAPATSDVFKAFVYYDELPKRVQLGQTVNGNFKQVLSFSEVYATEKANKIDINLDGIIGEPPVKALLSSEGLTGPAVPDAPLPREVASVTDLITTFYRACLNRDPDRDGLIAWTRAIEGAALSKADVLVGTVKSQEFFADQASPADFVTRLYKTFLMRAPSADELDAWRDAVDDGVPMTKIVNGFAQSAEFKALIGIANHG